MANWHFIFCRKSENLKGFCLYEWQFLQIFWNLLKNFKMHQEFSEMCQQFLEYFANWYALRISKMLQKFLKCTWEFLKCVKNVKICHTFSKYLASTNMHWEFSNCSKNFWNSLRILEMYHGARIYSFHLLHFFSFVFMLYYCLLNVITM